MTFRTVQEIVKNSWENMKMWKSNHCGGSHPPLTVKFLLLFYQSLRWNTDNDEHAKYFLYNRGINLELVVFDIPKSLNVFKNENAIL